jgi:trehalose 6-phosphate synthase
MSATGEGTVLTSAMRGPARHRPVLPAVVCASHREPWERRRVGGRDQLVRTTGGLVTALDAALRDLGGTWISANGHGITRSPTQAAGRSYALASLELTPREVDGYYGGFSNRVLWPLFHYFVGRVNFDRDEWHAYERVNGRFAEAMAGALDGSAPGTAAWIHDYHLLLAPRRLRELRPRTTIGFFLHVPFPAFEVFRILPVRREILDGLLGADLLGFHSGSYQDAFLDSVQRLLGAKVDKAGAVFHRGRRTRTLVTPIGIDTDQHRRLAHDPRTGLRAQRLRRAVPGEHIVLGIDRLDYSKGLLERLSGLQRLFENHPEHRGRVTLLQLAVPSRTRVEEYRVLKREVDEAVGRLEGQFGDAEWSPVRYVTRSLQSDELAAWYRAADVALVTPLRDGLNLVAKEYVASRPDHGGALVLSEFAGAADELPQAYLVNPFGPDSVAEGLHRALTDDRVERERRMAALQARVEANDVRDWAGRFLRELARGA